MICPNPKCNNTRTDIKSEKQEVKGKEVLRNRYCSKCDTSFSTKEKINIITKRKPRPDKLLMNFRFYMYGTYRQWKFLTALNELEESQGGLSKIKNKFSGWGAIKKSGKSGVALTPLGSDGNINIKNKKIFNSITKKMIEGKKKTIQFILSSSVYWKYKNFIMKKELIKDYEIEIINSRLNKLDVKKWKIKAITKKNKIESELCNKVIDEIYDFQKSVSMYINNKEYDQNFYINYKIEEKFSIWNSAETKVLSDNWKSERTWFRYINSK